MSSEISIEPVRLTPEPAASASGGAKVDAGFRPWHFFVMASLLLATVAVVIARQSTPANLVLISLTIGAAGASAAGFYRMCAPLVTPDLLLQHQVLCAQLPMFGRATKDRQQRSSSTFAFQFPLKVIRHRRLHPA